MTARTALRAATSTDHDRVDRLFSQFDLASAEGYRLFLAAQATAHLPIEEALNKSDASRIVPDWPARRRGHLLEADLAELGLSVPPPVDSPTLADAEAVLGAVYVLEGSRLGGALLKRAIPAGAPSSFLGADQPPGAWRKLLALLDECLYEPRRLQAASRSAKQIFERFEIAGRRYLETAKP